MQLGAPLPASAPIFALAPAQKPAEVRHLPIFNQTSPTQVEDFNSCNRKWAWDKLAGLERLQHHSAALGERVHNILEGWELQGIAPDENEAFTYWDPKQGKDVTKYPGKIAMVALEHLPAPGTEGMTIENKFKFEHEGIIFNGRKDLEYWRGADLIVHDHKTTSDFKWAKTRDVLRTDPQGTIYSFESFRRIDIPQIELNWLYLLTQAKPRAKKVELIVYRDDVAEQMKRLTATAHVMKELREANAKSPVDVLSLPLPEDLSICEAFGGCSRKERCIDLTPGHQLSAFISQAERKEDPMSTAQERLLASIQAKRAAEGGAAPVVPVAPAPAVQPAAPPAAAPAPTGLAAQLLGQAAPRGVNPPPYVPPTTAVGGITLAPVAAPAPTTVAIKPSIEKAIGVAGRLAKMGLAFEQIAEALAGQFDDLTSDDIAAILTAPQAPAEPPAPAAAPVPVPVPVPAPPPVTVATTVETPATPKRGPGRPKKATTTTTAEGAAAPAEAQHTTAVGQALSSALGNAFILCVDCVPVKGAERVITLGELLEPVHAKIKAELELQHYKFAEFGKGPGILSTAVKQYLEQNPLGTDVTLVISSRSTEGADCLNVLESLAAMVIRGT